MLKVSRLIFLFSVLLIVIVSFTACSSTSATTAAASTATATTSAAGDETAAIRSYADPATKTALEGLSEGDLAKYTQFANAQFKTALTKDAFDKSVALIKNQLGDFASITFKSTEKQDNYIIVHYRAKYAKGETGVRMVFDQEHLIAGQWFEQ